MGETLTCPYCGDTGPNSYWLIDHAETCAVRWAGGPVMSAVERARHHHQPWIIATFRWTQTTTVPLDPSERKVTVQVSNVSFSDSSAGESGVLTITDLAGVAVPPASPPTWVSDDGGVIVTLTVADDGMSATAAPAVPVTAGTANITITATDAVGTVLTFATSVTVTAGPEAAMAVAWADITPVAPAPAPTPPVSP